MATTLRPGSTPGRRYVFVRSGNVWTERAHLFASDEATFDELGYSVAASGSTVVAGAYLDTIPGRALGRVGVRLWR
jgi:FG-GAP repeat